MLGHHSKKSRPPRCRLLCFRHELQNPNCLLEATSIGVKTFPIVPSCSDCSNVPGTTDKCYPSGKSTVGIESPPYVSASIKYRHIGDWLRFQSVPGKDTLFGVGGK